MRVEVTKDVANHLVNDDYNCLLIHFEQSDKHFFWDKRNWMPKDDEVFKIFSILYNLSPTFKERVLAYIEERGGIKND